MGTYRCVIQAGRSRIPWGILELKGAGLFRVGPSSRISSSTWTWTAPGRNVPLAPLQSQDRPWRG